ncbi:TspO/MBR-related protein [Xylariaceae sp. FL0662B]|nr:TspO/MBR-related protein [Xylariaceae sp. FL0662B]
MTTFMPHLTALPHALLANPAASILVPITLGTTVGFGTLPKNPKATYDAIKQPPLRPPPQVFGPVWTTLYGLAGYAAHRAAAAAAGSGGDRVRVVYAAQLALNLAWMPLFFCLRRPALALADAGVLFGLNAYLARLYFASDAVAAACHLPYLAWLAFATYINAGVGYLNDWDISEAALAKRAEKKEGGEEEEAKEEKKE